MLFSNLVWTCYISYINYGTTIILSVYVCLMGFFVWFMLEKVSRYRCFGTWEQCWNSSAWQDWEQLGRRRPETSAKFSQKPHSSLGPVSPCCSRDVRSRSCCRALRLLARSRELLNSNEEYAVATFPGSFPVCSLSLVVQQCWRLGIS